MHPIAWLFPISLVSFIAFGASSAFANSVVETSESTVVVAAGASKTMSVRRDYGEEWFFAPNVSAYFWRAIKYVQVGAGSGVHFWAIGETGGGPIFTPSLGLEKSILLNHQLVSGLTATGGWLIGHYNDEWHHGLAVTLGPKVEIVVQNARIFEQPFNLRFGLEATLFYTGEASRIDRYQPVLSLGATIGFAFPVLWTRD